jgi:stearoyl-CoA desaturase (delta-9 desaturase)
MQASPREHQEDKPRSRGLDWLSAAPFFGVHVAAIVGVYLVGFSWKGVALAMALYFVRMFGVTAGYHRYFAHRTYKAGRGMQFFLAVLATTSNQKGVLWWAAHHRVHHKFSDKPEDIHSMKLRGFWWSHVGWILSHDYDETDWDQIKDLSKYPELRWLNKYHLVPVVALAVVIVLAGGWSALVWGFFVSTMLLWHGTFTINSLSHWMGRRRYATTDESKNSLLLALLTMGEGWHNNHHYYPRATNQGFYWWEIDVTYYVLRGLEALHLVSDLHTPPAKVRDRRMPARERASAPVSASASASAVVPASALDIAV